MTERPLENPRIDLRALDADDARVDRVVGATMAVIAHAPARIPGDVADVLARRIARPAAVVAALLSVAAAVIVTLIDPEVQPQDAAAQIATVQRWSQAQYVPTNGDLLLTFQGYSR